jgi:hypothetical protein
MRCHVDRVRPAALRRAATLKDPLVEPGDDEEERSRKKQALQERERRVEVLMKTEGGCGRQKNPAHVPRGQSDQDGLPTAAFEQLFPLEPEQRIRIGRAWQLQFGRELHRGQTSPTTNQFITYKM